MPLANTPDRYGVVSRTLHWLTALLVLSLIPLGVIASDMGAETSAELATKARLFSLHKTLGVASFFVALVRILWALGQVRPAPLHPDRRLESLLADTVHWLLYGALVLVPLSGWVHHAATAGFAPIWWPFGQSLPLVRVNESVAAISAGLHIVFGRVLILSILLHIAGALRHHLFDRDGTLGRMWSGWAPLPDTHRPRRNRLPFLAALTAWVAAILLGLYAGVFEARPGAVAGEKLDEPQSEWQVTEGTLAITVTQFGTEIQGQFADWSAVIAFDETIRIGAAGALEVTVAIGSLTLGSVTDQAMGPDFFDIQTYPTATYIAEIAPITDGYVARGTLMIRDRNVPVALPFGLSVDGDTASMVGSVTLDRRDFGIGDNMADESALKFLVTVDVELIATRDPD